MDASNGSRKAVLMVLLVFVLGIALGGIGMYVVTTRVHAERGQAGGHNPANTMAMFTRDLNLTPEQQTEIQAILSDTRAHYGELHDKFDPEYERVRHEGRERIRQTLTAEQRPKFEDLLRRIDEDRRRRQAAQGH
jgi:Spy/CpxP family protein refolding chaperone